MSPLADGRQAVFVYGSLKAGEANHHWLAGARSLGRRRLVGAVLHDLGPYPMALLQPGGGVIHGELYGVDAKALARLDQLEDVPAEYLRSLRPLSDGAMAWVYHGRPAQVLGSPSLPLGDWRSTPVLHYGSNLDPVRLRQRCPGWDGQGLVVHLPDWHWAIDKRSRGGDSGCAGIRPRAGSHCWGVVTHLNRTDVAALDGHEGVSLGHYVPQQLTVEAECGARFPVRTYVPAAAHRREGLRPAAPYREHILAGLRHWPLPRSWCESLAAQLDTLA
ncbi:MAG: gamma-glutamylcyclotransferase [Synechococcaceae cyanobacterium]|nr:gamma-glutamylcyclotransferase [Synechococcaceae cyanobacterium]